MKITGAKYAAIPLLAASSVGDTSPYAYANLPPAYVAACGDDGRRVDTLFATSPKHQVQEVAPVTGNEEDDPYDLGPVYRFPVVKRVLTTFRLAGRLLPLPLPELDD